MKDRLKEWKEQQTYKEQYEGMKDKMWERMSGQTEI
jgi:hypothetical protein